MKKNPLTTVWLCALLAAALTSRAAAATGHATIGDLKSVNELLLASSLADVCAAILLFRVVRAVTALAATRLSATCCARAARAARGT